ncbi:MAG: DUF3786 domain-containing protein [Promethearchaeota archaeon]
MELEQDRKFSWSIVKDRVHKLTNSHGFDSEICFINFKVNPSGELFSVDTENWSSYGTQVKDETLLRNLYRILYYYANSPDRVIPRKEEELIKVSRLNNRFQVCSTNQHLIEEGFRQLFDQNTEHLGELLTSVFSASPSDQEDTSYRVPLLPYLPIWIVYYEAEEDGGLSSSVEIFFEKHATNYLPQELCEGFERIFLNEVNRLF